MSRPEQAPKQSLPQVFSHFVDNLPGDPETDNTRRQVSGACYSLVAPTAVAQPETMAYATEVAAVLGLSGDFCQSALFARVMGGNELLPGMKPYAMCYGGHQFGNWAGQLGDGRAINLGEVINPQGERWTLQLKGAGPTPYSRSADGRAVVRSSVREFLCSEAMHHLGVPTTRALSLVTTGDDVVRDMFYDGNAKPEPGAIVCRVAPSFLRFGSYQLFAARGELTPLKQLVDYTIETSFSELGKPSKRTYIKWFETVCRLTAEMMVHWMRVGFVHGVMNTDNMSILGLTIDYGPYGWLDNYDPDWTPNTTDAQGRRYRFGHQPQIAMWNLAQLGNAIYPLVEDLEPLQESLNTYTETFGAGWDAMMAAKLGLEAYRPETDDELIKGTQRVLQAGETDMTLFYRNLADIDVAGSTADMIQVLSPAFYGEPSKNHLEQLHTWLGHYCARLKSDSVDGNNDRARRRERMNQVNPKFVLRNYLAQLAIDKAEQGDGSLVVELLEVMRRPYDEQPEHESFAAKRPEWARSRAGCSMLSCSS